LAVVVVIVEDCGVELKSLFSLIVNGDDDMVLPTVDTEGNVICGNVLVNATLLLVPRSISVISFRVTVDSCTISSIISGDTESSAVADV
jgi:hypothetical protein